MHAFDCEITFTFRFDLRVNSPAKTVNIRPVQRLGRGGDVTNLSPFW